jgi:cell division septum initiation protein DivIVA
MTNTSDTAREQFEIVRRGYEPQQVDRRISALAREAEAARGRVVELERRVEELHTQGAADEAADKPAFAGLGKRIEQILELADEEAKDLRDRVLQETEQHRGLSEQAAEKVRAEAERYAQERRSEADAEAARVLEDARRQADQLRDSTERDAKARREEAEALFESNRAKAAQAAADFETTLAHRREQAEHDYTEQMKANEQQLTAVTHRAEQLRLEAEKLRADSDRKAKRLLDEAQRQADEMLAEAKSVAERIRSESERELSAATQRRDSINAQLTNVRQMLATLTGATVPNPFGDDTPAAAPEPTPPAATGANAGGAPAPPVSNVSPKDTAANEATRNAPGGSSGAAAGNAAPAAKEPTAQGAPAKDGPATKDGQSSPVDTNSSAPKVDSGAGKGGSAPNKG